MLPVATPPKVSRRKGRPFIRTVSAWTPAGSRPSARGLEQPPPGSIALAATSRNFSARLVPGAKGRSTRARPASVRVSCAEGGYENLKPYLPSSNTCQPEGTITAISGAGGGVSPEGGDRKSV